MGTPLVLAHRGARREAPENTVAAFRLALAQGADGVELDVHRTADDGLVVHHDAGARGLGVLATQSTAAILAARPDIPTLDEALDVCTGALVNVEIKNLPGDADYDPAHATADLVVAALERRGWRDDVVVSSFNLASVDRVRTLSAGIPTALLAMPGFDLASALDACVANGHGGLHPSVATLSDGVAESVTSRAHALGVAVRVWTVNDDDDVRRLAAAAVDAIITDVPVAARKALTA